MRKPFANGWNAKAERRTLEGMCDTWLAKTVRPNGPTVETPSPNGADHAIEPYRVHWHGEPNNEPLREWLVESIIPKTGTGLISGQWGTYKTFVSKELAGCVIAGQPFAGHAVLRRGGVFFIAVEGQGEVRLRFQAMVDAKIADNLAGDLDIAHLPFAWIEACPKLSAPNAVNQLATVIKPIAEAFEQKFRTPLSLIIIDTLTPAAQFKDASDTAEAQHVMTALKTIAHMFQCFVVAVDHFGKDPSTGTRDSSVKESDVDTVLALLGERSLSGEVDNPRMAVRKVRGAATGQVIPFTTRKIEIVDASARRGKIIESTLVIDFAEAAEPAQAARKRERWPKSLSLFKRALDASLEQFGQDIRPFVDGATVHAVTRDRVREEFLASYPADGSEAKRKAFFRTERDAVTRGLLAVRELGKVQWFWPLLCP
jgi:hypothetical protein